MIAGHKPSPAAPRQPRPTSVVEEKRDINLATDPPSPSNNNTIKSVCLGCGSCNVIRFQSQSNLSSNTTKIQCRSCLLVSPNCNAPRGGILDNAAPHTHSSIHAMVDAVLDAFTQPRIQQKLQQQLEKAGGDVALICYFYLPIVIDTIAFVVSQYGFVESLEGVKESIRAMQNYAQDDEELVLKIIRIRKILTPTGDWIKEDAEAEANRLRKKVMEEEVRIRQEEDAKRMEALAAENIKNARLRMKKIALGLDPTVPQPPLLLQHPPSLIATHANHTVHLRVRARYTLRYAWYLNGKALANDHELVRGVNTNELVITRLTRRVIGDYYCMCDNEEGTVSSSTTRVQFVSISSQRLATKKLQALANGWNGDALVACQTRELSLIACCVRGMFKLMDTESLLPVNVYPPISAFPPDVKTTVTVAAWSRKLKLLALGSAASDSSIASKCCRVALISLNDVSSSEVPSTGDKPIVVSPSKDKKIVANTTLKGKVAPVGLTVESRQLSLNLVDSSLTSIECILFADSGRQLVLSDLKHTVAIYELSPTFTCKKVFCFPSIARIDHISTVSDPTTTCTNKTAQLRAYLAICFRQQTYLDLYDLKHLKSQPRRLEFKFPVHRSAFDDLGFSLAIAETGCMKTWISIWDPSAPHSTSHSSRFVAHVGKVSSLQWLDSKSPSLLISSGYDGYIKLWDLHISVCVFRIHLDLRGVHAMTLLATPSSSGFAAMGFTDGRIHTRQFVQFEAFEYSRQEEMNRFATKIQKVWKGRQTRLIVRTYLKSKRSNIR